MGAIFLAMTRRRTYLSALFIATRLPLGLFYFPVLLVGLLLGVTGLIVIVGIPTIVLTLLLASRFAAFERHLVRWWLGIDVAPLSPPRPAGRSVFRLVRDHLANPTTWRGLLYLFLQLPAGLIASGLVAAGLIIPIALALMPVWYLLDRLTYQPGDVQFSGLLLVLTGSGAGIQPTGLATSLVVGALGLLLLAWVLWIVDQIAMGWGAVASRLLGMSSAHVRLAEAHALAATEHQRAERADQSRRELIVNASHELRTPIASIRAHVESLLMREDEHPLEPEVTRYLDVIARETERLSALVDDLMAVARAEAGELSLTAGPVSATQVVRHVREAIGPMARRQRRVTLVERVPEGGLPPVLADADRLTQVLMNLVRNAVTYTPEGGLVSIEAALDGPEHVVLVVADTGIGIPPEDLERVFERFYRTDASRARATGGFGLGLSIARDLIDAMGGTISVESEVDTGSRFTVRLPVAQPAEVR